MKKYLIASVAAVALSASSAFAADMGMPLKAPAPPPPAVSWTGCYVDANWGYGLWNQDHNTETPAGVPLSLNTTDGGRGWLGRFGGGCDYQFGLGNLGNFVIGAFGDYDIMDLSGTSSLDFSSALATPFFGLSGPEKQTDAWYVGGRIGYLVTPSLLTYFDGGYTETRFDQVNYVTSDSLAFPVGTNSGVFLPAHTYTGWFLGGGTEYAMNFSWLPISGLFWRSEYRYADYNSSNIPTFCAGGGAPCGAAGPEGVSVRASKVVQTITSGLVWRFNFGGPVAARY